MKKSTFFLAAFVAILFAGCTSPKELNGKWTSSEVTVNNQVITGATAEVLIEKTGSKFKVNGTSGVNSISGTVTMNKNKFKAAENFASTKMMGAPAEQNFEDNFLSCLMSADSYSLENNVLVIKDSKTGNSIKFYKN